MKMPPPPRSNALRHHPLALCLGAACVAATPFQAGIAATLPVTSCADDGSPGTLRSVIDSAVDGDVVDLTQLTCSTITLTQGTIGTDFLSDHPVNYLTIQGPGRDALTISGGGQFLVFAVGGYGLLPIFTLNDVTIADGINVNTASPWYESGACIFESRGVRTQRINDRGNGGGIRRRKKPVDAVGDAFGKCAQARGEHGNAETAQFGQGVAERLG